jgi:hypothetical protein
MMNAPYAKTIKMELNCPLVFEEGSLKKKPNMKHAIIWMIRVITPNIKAFRRIPSF